MQCISLHIWNVFDKCQLVQQLIWARKTMAPFQSIILLRKQTYIWTESIIWRLIIWKRMDKYLLYCANCMSTSNTFNMSQGIWLYFPLVWLYHGNQHTFELNWHLEAELLERDWPITVCYWANGIFLTKSFQRKFNRSQGTCWHSSLVHLSH